MSETTLKKSSFRDADNSTQLKRVMLFFSICFLIGAIVAEFALGRPLAGAEHFPGLGVFVTSGAASTGSFAHLFRGLVTICTTPDQFTLDYFWLAGVGSAFLNTALCGFACWALYFFSKAKATGTSIAAYWLVTDFATFGMTILNMWPFVLGVFIYSRITKKKFADVVNLALFATAIAPLTSELLFRYPHIETVGFRWAGLIGALILGIVTGLVAPAIIAHCPAFHKGFDLYNAGPGMGFIAFLACCILYRAPGIEIPTNTHLGVGHRGYVIAFFAIVFLLCIIWAHLLDRNCFNNYKQLWAHDGVGVDYAGSFGIGATLLNIGLYGFFVLIYFSIVHGMIYVDGGVVFEAARFTGPTMGAIMCMMAFCCAGAQPRTVFPIAVGYAVASFLPFFMTMAGITATQNWSLSTQAILVGMCFASGLAPLAGRYGFFAGVIAGAFHAILVMSVPLMHGGFCLYNGGFTAGIVCFIMVPVMDHFKEFIGQRKKAKE